MSKRWPGGIVTKTQATPTGPYENGSAPGIWTLNQMSYWVKQALWPLAGNVNPNAFIENLFSTYLYTGNGTSQTITNSINLSGQGGLVWIKGRNQTWYNYFYDTNRGVNKWIASNVTNAQSTDSGNLGVSAFNTSGFTLGDSNGINNLSLASTYASWTFRKQPKFFDIVTYTGNGTPNFVDVTHNLGSVPGCIMIKQLNGAQDWEVYHRSIYGVTGGFIELNTTGAQRSTSISNNYIGVISNITSTGFRIEGGTLADTININGGTYVAYLFAHDAGGFGLSGTENVISCGSFTTNGSGVASVTLGYEPQYLLVKRTNSTSDWFIWDSMRGLTMDVEATLWANKADAEESYVNFVNPTATGFVTVNGFANSSPYIYIAIRRGPMAVPTLGTSVFYPTATLPTGVTQNTNILTSGFPIDSTWRLLKDAAGAGSSWVAADVDRLRGNGSRLSTNLTDSESAVSNSWAFDSNTSIVKRDTGTNNYGTTQFAYAFKRAPGFFDVVCYTGTGVATTVNHNLGVAPELMIVKNRSAATSWKVYSAALGATAVLELNQNFAFETLSSPWNNTSPTSSVFTVGTNAGTNQSSGTHVAYLFATCAGVSKVGSYTGTGATLNINAGFTTGARFVMIKRTDSTGNWFVWDTARGMVAGTDPRIALNSTAAELNNNWVYTASSGFQIVTTDASVNASGGSYIYLAIA